MNWIKQLFCRHNWITGTYTAYGWDKYDNPYCEKCGIKGREVTIIEPMRQNNARTGIFTGNYKGNSNE